MIAAENSPPLSKPASARLPNLQGKTIPYVSIRWYKSQICGMHDHHAIKVMLRSPDGRYLAGHRGAWTFADERKDAHVFDYVADRIPQQLEALEHQHGLVLTAVALDPRDRYEVCDCCGQQMMSLRAFFDGSQYLCPDCQQKSSSSGAGAVDAS
jgi:hypothetical protein